MELAWIYVLGMAIFLGHMVASASGPRPSPAVPSASPAAPSVSLDKPGTHVTFPGRLSTSLGNGPDAILPMAHSISLGFGPESVEVNADNRSLSQLEEKWAYHEPPRNGTSNDKDLLDDVQSSISVVNKGRLSFKNNSWYDILKYREGHIRKPHHANGKTHRRKFGYNSLQHKWADNRQRRDTHGTSSSHGVCTLMWNEVTNETSSLYYDTTQDYEECMATACALPGVFNIEEVGADVCRLASGGRIPTCIVATGVWGFQQIRHCYLDVNWSDRYPLQPTIGDLRECGVITGLISESLPNFVWYPFVPPQECNTFAIPGLSFFPYAASRSLISRNELSLSLCQVNFYPNQTYFTTACAVPLSLWISGVVTTCEFDSDAYSVVYTFYSAETCHSLRFLSVMFQYRIESDDVPLLRYYGCPALVLPFEEPMQTEIENFAWRCMNYLFPEIREAVSVDYHISVTEGTWLDNEQVRSFYYNALYDNPPQFHDALLWSATVLNYAPLVIFPLGMMWSSVAVVVLMQKDFRKQGINLYLAFLCTIYIISSGVMFLQVAANIVPDLVILLNRFRYSCTVVELANFFMNTLSSELVVAISMERYTAVCKPFSRLTAIHATMVLKTLVPITLLAGGATFGYGYIMYLSRNGLDVVMSYDENLNEYAQSCGSLFNMRYIHKVFTYMQAIFLIIIPVVVIAGCSIAVIRSRVRSAKRWNQQSGGQLPRQNNEGNIRFMMTTLLVVNLTYILCRIPYYVRVIIIAPLSNYLLTTEYSMAANIEILGIGVNNFFTPLLLLISGSRFRERLAVLLGCPWRKPKRAHGTTPIIAQTTTGKAQANPGSSTKNESISVSMADQSTPASVESSELRSSTTAENTS